MATRIAEEEHKKKIRQLVQTLEDITDPSNAVVSFLEADIGIYFVRANPDGLQLLAKELLRISVEPPSDLKKAFITYGTTASVYSDIVLDYVECTDVRAADYVHSEQKTQQTKNAWLHTLKGWVGLSILVVILAIALSALVVGSVTIYKWLFFH